ncbi:Crp/Fnr family transcriptional regulator [Sphingorhabdus buctiana]|jgi:CRP-like cAMP-binding protein|uniref:Crp/Fnr family transcriptional regulator n=1 Tax=Sphingorhabdus buctiana TaxID=1508805 RepID=A0ABW4M9Z0_9SPHN
MSGINTNSKSGRNDIAIIQSCLSCGETSARRLSESLMSRNYAHRDIIAHMGDPSTHLFLVAEGAVVAELFGIDGQQAQLTRHGPGEVFGAYPEESTFRSAFSANGATRLLAVPTTKLAELVSSDVELAAGIANLMARQLDLLLDRMAARIGLSATGRFYRALLQLADGNGTIRPAPVLAAMAVSVHTTRETASRALAVLFRRGIVERQEDALKIVSRRMLEELIV